MNITKEYLYFFNKNNINKNNIPDIYFYVNYGKACEYFDN